VVSAECHWWYSIRCATVFVMASFTGPDRTLTGPTGRTCLDIPGQPLHRGPTVAAVAVETGGNPADIAIHVRHVTGPARCRSLLAIDVQWDDPEAFSAWTLTAPRVHRTRFSGDPCYDPAVRRPAAVPPTVATLTGEQVPVPPRTRPGDWAVFCANVAVIPGSCAIWLGRLFGDGYGVATSERLYRPDDHDPASRGIPMPRTSAHRFAVQAFSGPLLATQLVRHTCDERLCCPITAQLCAEHLELGDHFDNAHDRASRGRGASRRYAVRGRRWADTRSPYERSRSIQAAVRLALADRSGPDVLAAAYHAAVLAGDPWADQGELFPLPDAASG
jgi:hypothetical protein